MMIENDEEKMNIRDIKKLSKLYWLLFILLMTGSNIVWTFSNDSNKWINLRFGIDEVSVSDLMSYQYII